VAQEPGEERWEQGSSALFQRRKERREADTRRRRSGRKFIKGEEVKLEWEEQNGVWMGGLVSQDLGFDNRIIEVDCHIYPAKSHSCTHRHNEAIIIVLRGRGYSILDDQRIEWGPGDTLYIGQGVWHQHYVTSEDPAMVIAIKPLPIQEYMGELNIVYKGDKPSPVQKFTVGSFKEEFEKINKAPR
jgi:mannose-6-phosphate isomerase-like protein (cupin superfamily)